MNDLADDGLCAERLRMITRLNQGAVRCSGDIAVNPQSALAERSALGQTSLKPGDIRQPNREVELASILTHSEVNNPREANLRFPYVAKQ